MVLVVTGDGDDARFAGAGIEQIVSAAVQPFMGEVLAAIPAVQNAKSEALAIIGSAKDQVVTELAGVQAGVEAAAGPVLSALSAFQFPAYEDGYYLPAASGFDLGRVAFVRDIGPVYSDGADWRRFGDGSVYVRPTFPKWVPSHGGVPARLFLDFVRDRYWAAGTIYSSLAAFMAGYGGWAATSSGTVFVPNAAGLYSSVAGNTPIQPFIGGQRKGLFVWPNRPYRGLAPRDGSNAAWIKNGLTAVRNATGCDGAANSATMITANTADATILQTTTVGSGPWSFAPLVKKVTGTAQFTVDGVTWIDINADTDKFVEIATSQVLANPTFGFRLRNPGDSLIFDMANVENSAVPSGVKVGTSSVQTVVAHRQFTHTGSAGLPLVGFDKNESVIVATATPKVDLTDRQTLVSLNDGTTANEIKMSANGTESDGNAGTSRLDATVGGEITASVSLSTLPGGGWKAGVSRRLGMRVAPQRNRMICAPNFQSASLSVYSGAIPTTSQFRIGSGAGDLLAFSGYVETIAVFNGSDFGGTIPDVVTDRLAFDDGGRTPISCWGDSLTAGQGVRFPKNGIAYSYPSQLADALWRAGKPRRVYNFGVSGQSAAEISARQLADQDHRGDIQAICIGTNAGSDDTIANVVTIGQQMVAHLSPGNDKFVFISPTGQSTHTAGTPNFIRFRGIYDGFAAAYPGKTVDVYSILRANGDGSANDNADIAAGLIPRSQLAADRFHWHDGAYGLEAAAVISRLVALGAIAPL